MRILSYRISRTAYRNADAVVLSTEKDAEFVMKKFKVPKDKISVIPNTIDTDLFSPGANDNEKRNRILYIGRLTEVKNLHIVIEALSGTGIGFDIYGKGELKNELIKLAELHKVDLKIYKSLPNEKLPEIYRQYPIFVLMSQFEGNSKVLLEAMSCGRTVVASNIPGNSAIIKDRINGILVEPNPCELRKSIEELLKESELRKKLSLNARETIVSKYDIEKTVKQYQSVYKKVVNNE